MFEKYKLKFKKFFLEYGTYILPASGPLHLLFPLCRNLTIYVDGKEEVRIYKISWRKFSQDGELSRKDGWADVKRKQFSGAENVATS